MPERLRVIVCIAGNGLRAPGRSWRNTTSWFAIGHETFAVAVQPEQLHSRLKQCLEQAPVPGHRHAQLGCLQLFGIVLSKCRMSQYAVQVRREILRCDFSSICLGKLIEQAGQDIRF